MHHLLEHINQDIKSKLSKDKDSTVNKTEYRSKRNPTGKPLQYYVIAVSCHVLNHAINNIERKKLLKQQEQIYLRQLLDLIP